MSEIQPAETSLEQTDGHATHVFCWSPSDTPRGVIQLLHGVGEYSLRYDRFAQAAVAQDFAVVAHDHRGHGGHDAVAGFFARDNGWERLLSDIAVVENWLRDRFPEVPVVLLGHSMGSYLAQTHAATLSQPLAGLLISGSTWPSRAQILPGRLLARFESFRQGETRRSELLDKLGFGAFNKPFEPARTELDWLTRDEHEVDKYIADPLCGGPFTNSLWVDMLGGLIQVASDALLQRIPADLPILITGGADDPVGGDKGMTKLAMHYAQTMHQQITVKIYDGGRHEMLNETNRDAVTQDWLQWMKGLS